MKHNTQKLLDSAIFEVLEDRRLMSGSPLPTASLSNGVLGINDTNANGANVTINLANNGSQLTVDVQGQHSTYNTNQVKKFNITTGSGSDNIYLNPAIDIPTSITTGNGNDTIRAGAGDNDIIAGNGNDMIYGRGGDDVIVAGDGNDTIRGGAGDNSFTVGNGNDSIVSGGGDDKIMAGNGNDTFLAGASHDTITTGTGHDVMIGGLGNTYLYGKNPNTKPSTTGGSTTSAAGSGSSSGSSSSNSGGSSSGNSGGSSSGNSGSTKPVVPTVPTGSSAPGAGSGSTSKDSAPVAKINLMSGPRVTGMVVNVDGLSSKLGVGTPISTNYAWDFGDPGTGYDQMTGYNGGHVYDQAGTYTITLTVTDSDGLTSKATQQVTIAASARAQIYVDPTNGSDKNSGSQNSPLKSLAAAFSRMGNNTEILLHAGQTFQSGASLHVSGSNVLIGRYGTGANPIIMRSSGNGVSTIASYAGTNGLTIQDITFTSPYGSTNSSAPKIGVSGIYLGGQNCTVRDCAFLNLDDAINENGNPVGTLIQNNTAPQTVGLRGYFVWGQGNQQVIIGNYAAGTTQEHNIRLVGMSEVTVEGNNLTNHDGKGCIEMHEGQYAWIEDNSVTGGDIRLGPLGLWGEAASSCTDWCVIEDNQLTNTFVYVNAGTHHAMIENNVINNASGEAITLNGTDNQGRTSADITIVHNTALDSGTTGSFITVWGWVSGIVMENNLWIAPKLQVGTYSSTPVYVNASNLDAFTLISENVWPSPNTIGTYANGGINYVAGASSNSYLTIAQWDQMKNVKGDIFKSVTLGNSYEVTIDAVTAGAAIQIAA